MICIGGTNSPVAPESGPVRGEMPLTIHPAVGGAEEMRTLHAFTVRGLGGGG